MGCSTKARRWRFCAASRLPFHRHDALRWIPRLLRRAHADQCLFGLWAAYIDIHTIHMYRYKAGRSPSRHGTLRTRTRECNSFAQRGAAHAERGASHPASKLQQQSTKSPTEDQIAFLRVVKRARVPHLSPIVHGVRLGQQLRRKEHRAAVSSWPRPAPRTPTVR